MLHKFVVCNLQIEIGYLIKDCEFHVQTNQIEVNGENTAPMYNFLKSGKWGIIGDDVQWNFAKFLVSKDGQAVDRYYPTSSPLTIEISYSLLRIPNVPFTYFKSMQHKDYEIFSYLIHLMLCHCCRGT